MIFVLYGVIIFFASAVGSFLGGGSGVIIKPLLTLFVNDTTEVINFISSVSVFSMSISSTIKYTRRKQKVDFITILMISAGSIIGGFAGKSLFDLFNGAMSDNYAKAYQAVMLAVLLTAALLYVNKGKVSFHLKNRTAMLLCGVVLGIISSFLGIGGGPINLVVLFYFFSMDAKTAAQNSLYIIMVSQIASLIASFVTRSIPEFPAVLLVVSIACGVLGGMVGRKINKKIDNRMVEKLFLGLLCVIVAVCGFNIYRFSV